MGGLRISMFIVGLILIVQFTAIAVIGDDTIADERVGHWKFNEGSLNIVGDQTSYNNDGTLSGSSWATGPFESCISFDGVDDYVEVKDSSSLDLGSKVSIELWMKARTFSGDGKTGGNALVMKWQENPTGQYSLAAFSAGGLKFWLSDGTTANVLEVTGVLTTNSWHHVVATWSGSVMTIYVDGVSKASQTTSITSLYSSEYTYDDLIFGYIDFPTLNEWHYNGFLDEISIYNYGLTATQVKDNYYSMVPKLFANETIGAWNMDDRAGVSIKDSSSKKNDGTIFESQFTRGISETGLVFDGVDDYVIVPDASSLDVEYGLTIEAWIMAKEFSGDGSTGGNAIVWKWKDGIDGQYAMFTYSGGGVGFMITDGTGGASLMYPDILTEKTWHHIAATWSLGSMHLYIDGVHISSKDVPLYAISTNEFIGDDLKIGANLYTGWYYNGIIDDVIIRNHALSSGEVAISFARYAPWTMTEFLISYWSFDEGSGDIATDEVGHRNGSIVGPDWARGLVGSALEFKGGQDQVIVQDTTVSDLLWGLSIEAWIYDDSFNGDGTYSGEAIAVKWVDSPTGEFALCTYTDGVVFFISDGNVRSKLMVEVSMETCKWHHLVGTWDGYKMSVFVDGVLEGELATPISYINQNEYIGDDIRIGYLTDSWSFVGKIDELKIYNHAIEPSTIEQTYDDLVPLNLPSSISLRILEDNNGIDHPQHFNDGMTYIGDTVTFSVDVQPFIDKTGNEDVAELLEAYVTVRSEEGDLTIPLLLNEDGKHWSADYTPDFIGKRKVDACVYEVRYDFNDVKPVHNKTLCIYPLVELSPDFNTTFVLDEDETVRINLSAAFLGGAPEPGDLGFDYIGNPIIWPLGWKVDEVQEHVYDLTPPLNYHGSGNYALVNVVDYYTMNVTFRLDFVVRPVNDPFVIINMDVDGIEYIAEPYLLETPGAEAELRMTVNHTSYEDNSITVTINVADIDGDTIVFSVIDYLIDGYSIADGNMVGKFTITPYENLTGGIWIGFRMWEKEVDPLGEFPTVWYLHIDLIGVNDPPMGYIQETGPIELNWAEQITLHGIGFDIDGDELTYKWIVGNKTVGSQQNVTLSWEEEGAKTVKLIISDGEYDIEVGTIIIKVGAKPMPPFMGFEKDYSDTEQYPIFRDWVGNIEDPNNMIVKRNYKGDNKAIDILGLHIKAEDWNITVTLILDGPPIAADMDFMNGAIYFIYFVKEGWTEPAFDQDDNKLIPEVNDPYNLDFGLITSDSLTYGSLIDAGSPRIIGNSIIWTIPQDVLIDAGIDTPQKIFVYAQATYIDTSSGITTGFDSIGHGSLVHELTEEVGEGGSVSIIPIIIAVIVVLLLIVAVVLYFVLKKKDAEAVVTGEGSEEPVEAPVEASLKADEEVRSGEISPSPETKSEPQQPGERVNDRVLQSQSISDVDSIQDIPIPPQQTESTKII